jgi:hypothetical protein
MDKKISKKATSPSDLNDLFGHNDLEGFAKFVGIDYDDFLNINQKNSSILKEENSD